MSNLDEKLKSALDRLELPPFVSIREIRDRYLSLVKLYHHDVNKKDSKISEINEAYQLLKKYADNFRFEFSQEEIEKQFPESVHARKFKF